MCHDRTIYESLQRSLYTNLCSSHPRSWVHISPEALSSCIYHFISGPKKKKKNSNYNLWSKNPTEVGAFNYYLALPVASVSHSWGQKKNLLHLTSLASHRIVFFSQRSCIHYVIHEHLKPQAAVTSTENLQGRKLKEWGKQC